MVRGDYSSHRSMVAPSGVVLNFWLVRGAKNGNLETTPLKGVPFRILQHNSNSFLDIALDNNFVSGYSIMFLVCKSIPTNFLGDVELTVSPSKLGGGG